MRSRLVVLVAAAIVVASVALAITPGIFTSTPGRRSARASLSAGEAAYLGVYERGRRAPISRLQSSRRPQADTRTWSGTTAAGACPLRDRSLRRSAATVPSRSCRWIPPTSLSRRSPEVGYDRYLRAFASSVRDFGHPMVIGFGHEMNADWYSWGYKHVPAPTFVAAWRHIVSLFRSQGADNVTWLWTINQDLSTTGPRCLMVAGSALRHLGRHRRLLLPPVQHLRHSVRPDHRPGTGLHRQAAAALGDRRRSPGRAGLENPRVCSPGCGSTRPSGSSGST